MKPVWWMAGLSTLSAFLASAALAGHVEIWLGMLAPLVVVSASWIFAARTYNERPEQLTSVMMTGFAAEAGVVRRLFRLRPSACCTSAPCRLP